MNELLLCCGLVAGMLTNVMGAIWYLAYRCDYDE